MKKTIAGNKPLQELIHDVAELAQYLWQKGWAERNAGNISVNIKHLIKKGIKNIDDYPSYKLVKSYPELAGGYFFVTGTGKRMRDLARNPLKNACIIKVNEKGTEYVIISWNRENLYDFRPTSELPTHLAIHQMLAQRNSPYKVIIHTHPNDLVALTHSAELKQVDKLNNILWGMHPETVVVVPKGVGVVPYILPGTDDIAEATVEALANHDVVMWEKHGCLAIGEEVFATFDLIDTLSKSAQIYLLCKSAGIEPEGLTDQQLIDLKIKFHGKV
jgi:rhamnulose-1-phosphate aldolase